MAHRSSGGSCWLVPPRVIGGVRRSSQPRTEDSFAQRDTAMSVSVRSADAGTFPTLIDKAEEAPSVSLRTPDNISAVGESHPMPKRMSARARVTTNVTLHHPAESHTAQPSQEGPLPPLAMLDVVAHLSVHESERSTCLRKGCSGPPSAITSRIEQRRMRQETKLPPRSPCLYDVEEYVRGEEGKRQEKVFLTFRDPEVRQCSSLVPAETQSRSVRRAERVVGRKDERSHYVREGREMPEMLPASRMAVIPLQGDKSGSSQRRKDPSSTPLRPAFPRDMELLPPGTIIEVTAAPQHRASLPSPLVRGPPSDESASPSSTQASLSGGLLSPLSLHYVERRPIEPFGSPMSHGGRQRSPSLPPILERPDETVEEPRALSPPPAVHPRRDTSPIVPHVEASSPVRMVPPSAALNVPGGSWASERTPSFESAQGGEEAEMCPEAAEADAVGATEDDEWEDEEVIVEGEEGGTA
ncbi:unnamed protein product [Vitrella brassicaformis CCMP3155]|uniref:Uncharacterized protein n=1 Tax=Vitrella brassicaformis (strain CCMP3155) TaxID=1169540 RepID=A0A0G4G671_VITBC|nr:unnamed protein product [Vitrella brassicaformis CCMP3155]|eukprot:CEM23943.1 unnamed protein product [Vitrella brassicaformis CCMP3155]